MGIWGKGVIKKYIKEISIEKLIGMLFF